MYYHIYFHDQSVLPNTKIIPACCLNFLYSQALTLFLCWDSETCSEEEDSVVSSLFRAIDGKKGKEGKEKKGKKEKAGKKGESLAKEDDLHHLHHLELLILIRAVAVKVKVAAALRQGCNGVYIYSLPSYSSITGLRCSIPCINSVKKIVISWYRWQGKKKKG